MEILDLKSIQIDYLKKGILRYGILLFDFQTAQEFFEDCKSKGIKILGIDAFILDGKSIQPLMEHSPDYSNLPVKDTYSSVHEYFQRIGKIGEDYFFEIVI